MSASRLIDSRDRVLERAHDPAERVQDLRAERRVFELRRLDGGEIEVIEEELVNLAAERDVLAARSLLAPARSRGRPARRRPSARPRRAPPPRPRRSRSAARSSVSERSPGRARRAARRRAGARRRAASPGRAARRCTRRRRSGRRTEPPRATPGRRRSPASVPFVDESVTRIARAVHIDARRGSAKRARSRTERLQVGARPIVTTPLDTSMSRRSVRPAHSITTCTSIARTPISPVTASPEERRPRRRARVEGVHFRQDCRGSRGTSRASC